MKTNRTFMVVIILLGAITFLSCSNDIETANTEDVGVSFMAGISQKVVDSNSGTRAYDNVWEANDAIGVFMFEHGASEKLEENRKYITTGGDGAFSPASGNDIYYPMNGSQVDFMAYYPYTTTLGAITLEGTTLTVNVENQAVQKDLDLLWAENKTGHSKSQGSTGVELQFSHRLAKLIINVKVGDGVEGVLEGMTMTIKNMYTQNTFNLLDGTLNDQPSNINDIIPYKVDNDKVASGYIASFEAIVIPNDYAALDGVKMEFLAGSNTYTWEMGAVTIESLNKYTYDIVLNRTGVEVNGGSITGWIDNPKGGSAT